MYYFIDIFRGYYIKQLKLMNFNIIVILLNIILKIIITLYGVLQAHNIVIILIYIVLEAKWYICLEWNV
jgi:hypothetical protein